ncbi:MAG: Ig-like domain-containing protein [Acutalibacteraceae bacterium]|nr:Ig-like domain-containing protein [Acutalibacteraceae bacterium]
MKKKVLLTAVLSFLMVAVTAVSAKAIDTDTAFAQVNESSVTSQNEEIATEQSTVQPTDEPTVAKPQLKVTSRTMGVAEKCNLSDFLANNLNVSNYTYSSSNAGVVSVDKDKITAVGTGVATVSVKNSAGDKAEFTITVKLAPKKLYLNKTTITIGVGETIDLNSSLKNGEGAYKIEYTCNNSKVTTVTNSGGYVTGKTVGTSTVTATTYNGVTANCKVIVKQKPTAISINKTSITLGVGETFDLNTSLPANEGAYSITYSSRKPNVASVKSAGGLVTALSLGETVVTATTYNERRVTCKVVVKQAPTEFTLNKTTLTLGVGETFDLNSKMNYGEGAYKITYSSNNTKVATVKSSGGLVTAKATGTVTITATAYNGKTASCKITVKKAPTSISLNKTALTLGIGETYDLNSKLPSGCGAYKVTYSSSNTKVADVKSSGGLVTATGKGTVTITATAYNGKKATCKITVKGAPTYFELSRYIVTIKVGKTYDLNSVFSGKEASHSVVYESADTKIATVKSAGGLVTAKATGVTSVFATAYNDVYAACIIVVIPNTNMTEEQQGKAVAKQLANAIPNYNSDLDKVSFATQLVYLYCLDSYYTMEGSYYYKPYGLFIQGEYSCAGATRALGEVLNYLGYSWQHTNENQNTHQWCELYMDGKKGWADPMAGLAGYGKYPY